MVQKCRVCGCEDAIACPGGCFWVEEDLCNKCAEAIFVCKKCGHNLYANPNIQGLMAVKKTICPSCGEDDDKLWILEGFGNFEADNNANIINPIKRRKK
jgi:hypothetical protein